MNQLGEHGHGAIWATILEKAYAKFNVSYSRIVSGQAMQSFRDLTGMPVEYFTLDK